MQKNKLKNFLLTKLKNNSRIFCYLSLVFGLLIVLVRLFDFFLNWMNAASVHLTFEIIFETILYDILYSLYISFFLGIIFLLISLINSLAAKIFYYLSAIFIVLGYIMLVIYFSNSAVPLGSDLFGYSLAEIKHTVSAAGGISIFQILGFIAAVVIIFITLFFAIKIKLHTNIINVFYLMCLLGFVFYQDIIPSSDSFASQTEYYLVVNKLDFFLTKTYEYATREEDELLRADYYFDSGKEEDITFKYINENFPFLHENNLQDVLSPFFKKSGGKPNFVFLIVESLGRGYSGKGAYLGSYTPFLDSLSEVCLYWENLVSTGGRTFAVLPSIFGSLPFARKGFLDLETEMPKHFSLINLLKSNGYSANFFHGGDAHFDNMDIFMKNNNVDFILNEKNFGSGYSKMPSSGSGFSWGYGDKDLFKRSLDIIRNINNPMINVYLTLSTHSPFLIANQEYYEKLFDNTYSKLNIDSDVKKEVMQYKNILSTVLYMDDAIRNFFNEYKKRKDFENTIFIITGDHRMPEIPIRTQLDRFHVPLFIYSPMLKRTARFSSLSAHFDILPSILAFLKTNYNFAIPNTSVFIGSGLDTARQFRNIHSYPLMRNKNELLDYVDKEYFDSDGTLFRIDNELNITKIDNDAMLSKLSSLFEDYKKRNAQFVKTLKLQP